MKKIIIKSIVSTILLTAMVPKTLLAFDFRIISVPANDQRISIASITNVIRNDAGNELVDIDEQARLTSYTYQKLIQMKHAEGQPYTMARVVSQMNDNTFRVHYFDASMLNASLFNNCVDLGELSTYKDPANNMPIVELDYFIIDTVNIMPSADDDFFIINNINEAQFTHSASFTDLSPAEKYKLGTQLFHGTNGKTRNIPHAIRLFGEVATQKKNLRIAVEAQVKLGLIYYNGDDVPQNNEFARRYLETAIAHQNHNPFQAVAAKVALGLIYYNGDGIRKDSATAIRYFMEVIANPYVNPQQTALTEVILGLIYYSGDDIVPQNYARARQCFDAVIASPNRDCCSTAIAQFYLGFMHYNGDGVYQNYTIARQYFALVIANQSHDSHQAQAAQEMLNEIARSNA